MHQKAWGAESGKRVLGLRQGQTVCGSPTTARLSETLAHLTFIAEGTCEARQAVTEARDVVAWPTAVHTLWACLAAAMPIETRRTD